MKEKTLYIFKNKLFLILLSLLSITLVESQDLKKEILIPFPNHTSTEKPEPIENIKPNPIPPVETKPTKTFIQIPFPEDKTDPNFPNIEFKKIESIEPNPKSTQKEDLPLEKILVLPEVEFKEPPTKDSPKSEVLELKETKEIKSNPEVVNKTIEEKSTKDTKPVLENKTTPTKEKGKALLENREVQTKATNSNNDKIFKKSKLSLQENGKEAKETSLPSKKEAKSAEVAITNLPNLEKENSKKGKDKKKTDESEPPFERSRYYLNRDDKPSATPELNTASSGEGKKANLAKMDQIRLLALDRKKNEAKNIIEGISEPEFKFKGLYELAVGLENSAKGDKKLSEESIPFHLTIITEAPKTDPIVPKSLWALSHLLFKIGDHTPALDHLSSIILNHSNSEFADDAIYLSGRIYEESTNIRNLNRAKKYYQMFLKHSNKDHFKNSVYLPFVKKRLEALED